MGAPRGARSQHVAAYVEFLGKRPDREACEAALGDQKFVCGTMALTALETFTAGVKLLSEGLAALSEAAERTTPPDRPPSHPPLEDLPVVQA